MAALRYAPVTKSPLQLDAKGNNRSFSRRLDPVAWIGPLSTGIDQYIGATTGYSRLVATKDVAGKAHHLAAAVYVAKFSEQIQKSDLVFDDFLGNTTRGVVPWRLRAV
jgi:hypothetical protein